MKVTLDFPVGRKDKAFLFPDGSPQHALSNILVLRGTSASPGIVEPTAGCGEVPAKPCLKSKTGDSPENAEDKAFFVISTQEISSDYACNERRITVVKFRNASNPNFSVGRNDKGACYRAINESTPIHQ